MALDASQILGVPQLAGCKVSPRGTMKKVMARNGGTSGVGLAGAVGSAIAGSVAGKKANAEAAAAVTSTAPQFHFMAWLALTASDLALVDVDSAKRLKLTTVLARVPRAQVASVELQKSPPMMSKPLVVTFADGGQWIFEVPAASKGDVKEIAAAFPGSVTA